MALTITNDNFQKEVMQSEKPVLLDFWAVWCGPCRMVAPSIDRLSEEYADKAVIGKVNVDEESALAEQFKVMSIPTIYVLKGGQVVERLIGARPYAELAAALDKHV
ncbi:MAG: thioredoxin [Ruminococcaceae bacterium]|nr:thioredoxin [Oscillospiraceae bacterium]